MHGSVEQGCSATAVGAPQAYFASLRVASREPTSRRRTDGWWVPLMLPLFERSIPAGGAGGGADVCWSAQVTMCRFFSGGSRGLCFASLLLGGSAADGNGAEMGSGGMAASGGRVFCPPGQGASAKAFGGQSGEIGDTALASGAASRLM